MKKGYEIVKPVHDAFPGLPERLHRLFRKCLSWYYSHGYPLKKDNPLMNGNLSAVDHVLRMADEYEAGMPGAGKMLADNLIGELRARFHEFENEMTDRQIRQKLFKEFFEAVSEFDKKSLADQTIHELAVTETEFTHIADLLPDIIAQIRAEKRRKESVASDGK